ncbi:MAG: hypothetical protein WCF54_14875 [Terracidiphilus sp.]
MRQLETNPIEQSPVCRRWSLRDLLAAATLFLASAAVVLWQNAHLCVLWDASYTLDTSFRIALGQMPYRDFPLVHSPLTFLIQAAIMRLTGRVFFHHVLYAAIVNGLATVLAWRIVLRTLRGHLRAAWSVSLLLAAPLVPLGIYSVLPFPSYDCDTAFSILIVILLLQRQPERDEAPSSSGLHFFLTGAVLPLPLFFKQNIGLPFLAAASGLIFLLIVAQRLRRKFTPHTAPANLVALLIGTFATISAAFLLLHFTAGVRNYLHWTIQFAAERRLPGLPSMLEIYAEPSLLWWLPCVAAALVILRIHCSKSWVPHPFSVLCEMGGKQGDHFRSACALLLLAAPFLWTLISLALSSDSEDRAATLLALWPLLLILSAALSLWNLCRRLSIRACIPILILTAMQGTFLSQQLWGSTYAIWPLLMLLVAELIAFLAAIEASSTAPHRLFLAPTLVAIIAATLLVCGSLYTASEERLSYAQFTDGPALHSSVGSLKGMAVTGPYLPDFEELLDFSAKEIPIPDGIILIPGEDPFYFATGRTPQFPVLLFDNATDPLSSPTRLVAEAERRKIRWLIVKRKLQIKEDVTPQREATLQALQNVFLPYRKLTAYDVYRRP